MKKVLYISNIEVPYRVRFFNQLSKHCDLTVLYESRGSGSRSKIWAKSEQAEHKTKYLRSAMDLAGILREVFSGYDKVIVGCFNEPIQALAVVIMRLFRRPCIINLDGETFLEGNSLKARLKRFVLAGAEAYLVAGEKSAESVRKTWESKPIIPYYFSSLDDAEIAKHAALANQAARDDYILVVGQYFDYKGMDIALEAARMNRELRYKFVGMGSRTDKFLRELDVPENVEVIPFLQKEELEREYRNCAMLVLPSRQECWGLVINEAASFGTPIVSTWGSGAAVEFLSGKYSRYLAKPGDSESLYNCICACMETKDHAGYTEHLLALSGKYSIEISVDAHVRFIRA